MAQTREIKTKIISIKKTQKITSAMQKVAASKMRKAEQHMAASMPYANKILEVVGHIASSHLEYIHPYFAPRPNVNRVGYIVVSTDRGLCGGLNINLFKMVMEDTQKWSDAQKQIDWCLFGSKAQSFFRYLKANVIAETGGLGDKPTIADLIGGIKTMLDAYEQLRLDRVFIAHNEFVSTVKQVPKIMQLLPIAMPEDGVKKHVWDYIYEPAPKALLNTLVVRYVESQVYQAVVDNLACEQVARMIAMKNATDNADELVDELDMAYNKVRQASITQEIAEIISGAAAV
jgi:F-type H+-transporting ATPase subunit gamma